MLPAVPLHLTMVTAYVFLNASWEHRGMTLAITMLAAVGCPGASFPTGPEAHNLNFGHLWSMGEDILQNMVTTLLGSTVEDNC